MCGVNGRLVGLLAAGVMLASAAGCGGSRTLEVQNDPTDSGDDTYKIEPIEIDGRGRETLNVDCDDGIDETEVNVKDNGRRLVLRYKCVEHETEGRG